eukprot:6388330-Pyramimonas_sp.AAC.1
MHAGLFLKSPWASARVALGSLRHVGCKIAHRARRSTARTLVMRRPGAIWYAACWWADSCFDLLFKLCRSVLPLLALPLSDG